MLIFNPGVALLIGWRGGRGGEWVRGEKEVFLKVNYCCRLSWDLRKEHDRGGKKKSRYADGAERKDVGIPPLATKTEGG